MVSKQKTAWPRGAGVVSSHVGAVLLVGSWLVAGGAAGQNATAGRPSTQPQQAVVAEASAGDAGADLDRAAMARSIKPKVNGNLPALMWGKLILGSRAAARDPVLPLSRLAFDRPHLRTLARQSPLREAAQGEGMNGIDGAPIAAW